MTSAIAPITQPVPAPDTLDEVQELLQTGQLVDMAGRPLQVAPCPACGLTTTGETCPQSLACPQCGAHPGQRCSRPSGHVLSPAFSNGWHAAREAAADAVDEARMTAGDPDLPAPWPATDGGHRGQQPSAHTLCGVPRQRSGEPVTSFDHDALIRIREERGLSHDQLAALMNEQARRGTPTVYRPQLINYEKPIVKDASGTKRRVRPGVHVLSALAKALEVDPFELLTVTPETATLADLRQVAGIAKADIATRLGISTTLWDAIERGRRSLQPEIATQAAKLLKVSRTQLEAALQRGIDKAAASPDSAPVE